MSKSIKDALSEPKRLTGAPIPVFDRLIDEDPDTPAEMPVKRYYTQAEVIQSIQREILRILNTRTTAKRVNYDLFSDEDRNFGLPEMFGLADFSQLDAANHSEWHRIETLCEQAISRYEPRIKNVTVTIVDFNKQTHALNLTIQADLALKEFQGEVTFPTLFSIGNR